MACNVYNKTLLIILLNIISLFAIDHQFIDVVIPCAPKDINTLNASIQGIKANGKNIRRIIIVSSSQLTTEAEWFDEKQYPFTKEDLAHEIFQDPTTTKRYLAEPGCNIGWIYQQFLKLYAPLVIPNISSHVLILDADTIFLRPVEFISKDGKALYNPGFERHAPYFRHMSRLLPRLTRVFPEYSGISNHMLFQRPILDALFRQISEYHNGIEPWRALCRCIDIADARGAGMSEYEIYFNFVFTQFSHEVKIRKLKWEHQAYIHLMKQYIRERFHYVSCHSYLQ